MGSSSCELSLGLEFKILVACPPLQPQNGHRQEPKIEPRVLSYDWIELKRQCLFHLGWELGQLIAKEQERGEDKSNNTLEELQRQQKNIQFISPERMENINATQLAIARSLQNKGLPVCYTIGNPLDSHDGQPFDLHHYLSQPDQLDTSIPMSANCFCVATDSTILPKPADVYDKSEFEWTPIEIATPVFRGDISHVGSSEIRALCATLRDEFFSWVNRSYDLHIHVSPRYGALDLQTAKKLVIIVWLLEPTLYTLAELNQGRRDDFQHKPITIHSMIARNDGYEGPARNVAEAERLLPPELHRFLREANVKDIYKVYQLALVCDAPDIPSLRRMIVGTNQQRLAINLREFSRPVDNDDDDDHHGHSHQRDYSPTIEFRFFSPTRDEAYARMCIKVAAAIFSIANLDEGSYQQKLGEIVEQIDRKRDRWRELLNILGLSAEAAAWENVQKQHCVDPRKPNS